MNKEIKNYGRSVKTKLLSLSKEAEIPRGRGAGSCSTKLSVMKDYPNRMTAEEARAFGEDVLNIVAQIPRGQVTTYGYIAALAGWPSHARMVGRTLRYTPGAEKLPCYRVVNKDGRTAPGWSQQRALLEAEGVVFKSNGHVDIQRHLWKPLGNTGPGMM